MTKIKVKAEVILTCPEDVLASGLALQAEIKLNEIGIISVPDSKASDNVQVGVRFHFGGYEVVG